MALFVDDFNDASINGAWTVATDTGGSITEPSGTNLVVASGSATVDATATSPCWAYQAISGDFDAYCKMVVPSQLDANYERAGMIVGMSGNKWIAIMRIYDGGHRVSARSWTVGGSLTEAYFGQMCANIQTIWLRIKRAGTTFSMFWADTKPVQESDWKQLTPSSQNSDGGTVNIGLFANHPSGAQFTTNFDYFAIWPDSGRIPAKPSITIDGLANNSVTLHGSAFVGETATIDTHYGTEWQIDYAAGDFSHPLYDSGCDTTNKTQTTVKILASSYQCKARCRYQDTGGRTSWSEWSDPVTFYPAPDLTKEFCLATDPLKIDADLVNFPVMVRLASDAGIPAEDLTAIFDELKCPAAVNDDFTGTNGDPPNTDRWWIFSGAPQIQSNKLREQCTSSVLAAAVISTYWLRGDFDIQIDFTLTTGPSTDAWAFQFGLDTDDNNLYYMTRRHTESTQKYVFSHFNDSNWSALGTFASADTTGKMRITRSGNTVTGYYWYSNAWVSLGSRDHGSNPDVRIEIGGSTWNSKATVQMEWDVFTVNSGTVIQRRNATKMALFHPGTGTEIPTEIERFDPWAEKAILHACLPTVHEATPDGIVLQYDKDLTFSSMSDFFPGPDGPPNKQKWSALTTPSLGTMPTVVSHKLPLSTSGTARTSQWVRSTLRVIGDFDISVDYTLETGPATNSWSLSLQLSNADNNRFIQVSRRYDGASYYYFDTNGWGVGTSTSDTTGRLRMTRIGDQITGYYWNGNSWVQIGTVAIGSPARHQPANITLGMGSWNSNPTAAGTFFNLIVNSMPRIPQDEARKSIGFPPHQAAADVWDSNFLVVHHMAQTPQGFAGNVAVRDSTNGHRDLATMAGSMIQGDLVTGPKDQFAIDFDGSNDGLGCAGYYPLSGAAIRTLETYLQNRNDAGQAAGWGDQANGKMFGQYINTQNSKWYAYYWLYGTPGTYDMWGTIELTNNAWYYITMVYDGTYLIGKVNNVADAQAARANVNTGAAMHWYTGKSYYGDTLSTILAEVRLSNIVRSAAWQKATYYTLIDNLLTIQAPPNTPSVTDVDEAGQSAEFTGSTFSDPDTGDTHHASQWQVDLQSGDFSDPLIDTGEDHTHLTSYEATGLDYETDYKVRVRYKDSAEAPNSWSAWSAAVNFTTLAMILPPYQPTISVDTIHETTCTLHGSAFHSDPGHNHHASQWQIDEQAGDWSTPVVDSGEDHTNLTSYPATGLTGLTDYKARVRYKDDSGDPVNEWSAWSTAQTFTTEGAWTGIVFSNQTPPDGTYQVLDGTPISCEVTDNWYAIAEEDITITVKGTEYTYNSPEVSYETITHGHRITWTPGGSSQYGRGAEVAVRVDAENEHADESYSAWTFWGLRWIAGAQAETSIYYRISSIGAGQMATSFRQAAQQAAELAQLFRIATGLVPPETGAFQLAFLIGERMIATGSCEPTVFVCQLKRIQGQGSGNVAQVDRLAGEGSANIYGAYLITAGGDANVQALMFFVTPAGSGDIAVTFNRMGEGSADIGLPFRMSGPGAANIYRVEGETYIRVNALEDPIREALEAAGVIIND